MADMFGDMNKSALSDEELEMVVGGVETGDGSDEGFLPTAGWICTISAECNGGKSCNPF